MGTGQFLPDVLPGTPNFQYVAGSTTSAVSVTGYVDAMHFESALGSTFNINSGNTITLAAAEHLNINPNYRLLSPTITVLSGTLVYLITFVVPQ